MQNILEPREIATRKYFTKTPDKPSYISIMLAVGAGLFSLFIGLLWFSYSIIGIVISSLRNGGYTNPFCCLCMVIPGVAFLLVGGFYYRQKKEYYRQRYNLAEPKPSDEQMDEWLAKDKDEIAKYALKKLDLVGIPVQNKDEPLLVIGPTLGAFVTRGKDKILRFSKYKIVVVYLTDIHLASYNCIFDFVARKTLEEGTQEYHYNDVVSVSTSNENSPFHVTGIDGEIHQIASRQQFALSVANNDKIEVTVAFPQVKGFLETGTLQPSGVEKAIGTIRSRLREKRGGVYESRA